MGLSMDQETRTELILIRHGQTEWNLQGRIQGHLHGELGALGKRQAEALAARLATISFEALYSSDLHRAVQTAEAIARKCGHAIHTDVRLREKNYGDFEGLTMAEVRERYPEDFARMVGTDDEYVIPGGESRRQKNTRAIACIEELAARHVGRRVLVVTHGGVLSCLFQYVLGVALGSPRRFPLYNAGMNTIFRDTQGWQLGPWGDIAHLDGLAEEDEA